MKKIKLCKNSKVYIINSYHNTCGLKKFASVRKQINLGYPDCVKIKWTLLF